MNWKEQLGTFFKATTFSEFKDTVKLEKYLTDVKCRKHRISLSKLRLSDHCLMIEVGGHAHPIVPREQRFCPHCPNIVESEIHFLTECPVYYRAPLFTKVMVYVPQFIIIIIFSLYHPKVSKILG